jgi:hypothetical protein
MPKLPLLTPDDSTVFGPSGGGRRATGADFGVGLSNAQAQAAQTLNSASLAVGNINRAMKVNESLMEFQNAANSFTQELGEGGLDDNGDWQAPPPPEEHQAHWDEKLQTMYDTAKETFGSDEGAFRGFKRQAQAIEYQTGFNIKKQQTAMLKRDAATSLAYTLDNEAILAANAMAAGDERGFLASQMRVNNMLTDGVQSGMVDPAKEKAHRDHWNAEVDAASVAAIIRKNPYNGLVELSDPENWPDMPPAKRAAFLQQADREVQRMQSLAITLENQAWTKEQRRQEVIGEQVYLQARKMQAEGTDPAEFFDWAVKVAAHTDRGTAKAVLDIAQGKNSVVTPTHLFDSFWNRIEAGESGVMKDLGRRYKRGVVNHQDYQTLRRLSENRDSENGNYKRSREFIKLRIGTEDVTGIPGSSARQTSALQSYERWYRRNPDAEWEEHEAQVEQLFEQFVPINLKEKNIGIAVEAPIAFARRRVAADGKTVLNREFLQKGTVDDVSAEIINGLDFSEKLYQKGSIDFTDYRKDLEVLQRWAQIVENRRQAEMEKDRSRGNK